MMTKKKILILGVAGMLGHALFTEFSQRDNFAVTATARSAEGLSQWFGPELLSNIRGGVDAHNADSIPRVLDDVKPDVVINCIGIIKQLPEARDPVTSISINSLFPHRLAAACKTVGARLIHFSTDCVFSGRKGMYTEDDEPDAMDLYGRTKLLGEVIYPYCITLRTSIIGHELQGKFGLIEWFLAQEGKVRGYTHAIYSGFPTVEIANIINKYVIPNTALSGLYHVSSAAISKNDLLTLVAEKYKKEITIEPYGEYYQNRALDSGRFRAATGLGGHGKR